MNQSLTVKLLFLTDIHLNHLSKTKSSLFLTKVINHYKTLKSEGAGKVTVVITGDIATAPTIISAMSTWRHALEANGCDLKFVCGNHDYYEGSIVSKRKNLIDNMSGVWLPTCGVVSLSESTALVGHDGWCDGGYANWFKSDLKMHDYSCIVELNLFYNPKNLVFQMLKKLSQESADYVYEQGSQALKTHKHLFIATHFPPFREASVWNGEISSEETMPNFSSKAMGDAILKLAVQNPDKQITVLCGHTHVGLEKNHVCKPASNVLCYTGSASYESPKISETFTIE